MLVDVNVKANSKFKKGDLLIANADGVFESISKVELLRDVNDKITAQKREIESLKSVVKTYQTNVTKILKGVVNNG